MDAYTEFAQIYDVFMQETPYQQWGAYIVEQLKEQGIQDGLVLDLGCGTGKLTRILAKQGFDMIGVDVATEMLGVALEEEADAQQGILYLNQDMREFELYGTVRAIVSCCDCINYITEEEELLEVFRLVNNYLDPKGIFFFDFNTEYKYRELLGEQTIAENREEGSFIWENYYDEEEQINEYDLTLYIRQEEGYYERYEETHYQKAYTLETIQRLIEESGLEYIGAFDDYTKAAPHEKSGRICVMAREKEK